MFSRFLLFPRFEFPTFFCKFDIYCSVSLSQARREIFSHFLCKYLMASIFTRYLLGMHQCASGESEYTIYLREVTEAPLQE